MVRLSHRRCLSRLLDKHQRFSRAWDNSESGCPGTMGPWWKIICQRPISPAHGNIMKKINAGILATTSLALVSSVASAQTSASQTTLVTVENYNRAQTDVNFAGVVKNGGFGQIRQSRERASPPPQSNFPGQRGTLDSFSIVDLDAGPVT